MPILPARNRTPIGQDTTNVAFNNSQLLPATATATDANDAGGYNWLGQWVPNGGGGFPQQPPQPGIQCAPCPAPPACAPCQQQACNCATPGDPRVTQPPQVVYSPNTGGANVQVPPTWGPPKLSPPVVAQPPSTSSSKPILWGIIAFIGVLLLRK